MFCFGGTERPFRRKTRHMRLQASAVMRRSQRCRGRSPSRHKEKTARANFCACLPAFLRTAFGPGPFRLFAVPTPDSKNWRSIDDLAELEARERVVVHAHLSRLGRLRKICSDHNHPFLSPNTSAGKARRDKLLLAQINPPLVRRGRIVLWRGR